MERQANNSMDPNLRLLMPVREDERYEKIIPLPMSEATYDDITKLFNLSDHFLSILKAKLSAHTQLPVDHGEDEWNCARFILQNCGVCKPEFSIVLTYQSKSQSTTAMIDGSGNKAKFFMQHLTRELSDWKDCIGAPMLVPMLLLAHMMQVDNDRISGREGHLDKIERLTGTRKYVSEFAEVLEKGVLKLTDLADLVGELNFMLSSLAYHERGIAALVSLHSFIIDTTKSYRARVFKEGNERQVYIQDLFLAKLEYLRPQLDDLIHSCQCITQRTQAQQNSVYSLIAQKDSAVNIEIAKASQRIAEDSRRDNIPMKAIAEDSKAVALATARDSAAMRVIAAVIILFLPATFTVKDGISKILQPDSAENELNILSGEQVGQKSKPNLMSGANPAPVVVEDGRKPSDTVGGAENNSKK
ncbi:hypothetical protein EJ08DRAFT_704531 [Tothia fuscella]|uniref:Uncharacterized protein n=1 Tax=Tothia fuscella TaxID=1048955 RepID=A0A9P4P589_9PEZI|nr:hypothetical protein EJ08DRAFT_704531 [Tothia fuscella]